MYNFINGKNKIRFIASAGLVADVLIERRVTQTAIFENDSTVISKYKSQAGYSAINIAIQLSSGIDMILNRRFNLRGMPIFRVDSDIFQTLPIKEHLWSSGVNFGLYYKIK